MNKNLCENKFVCVISEAKSGHQKMSKWIPSGKPIFLKLKKCHKMPKSATKRQKNVGK